MKSELKPGNVIARLFAALGFALLFTALLAAPLLWPSRTRAIAPAPAAPRPPLLDVPYVPAEPAASSAKR